MNRPFAQRIAAMNALTTWRWALGGAPDAYVRYWSGVLAWLTGEEEYRRVRLELPPAGAAPGDEVVLRLHARDDALHPVADAEARFTVQEADGSRRTEVYQSRQKVKLPLTSGMPVRSGVSKRPSLSAKRLNSSSKTRCAPAPWGLAALAASTTSAASGARGSAEGRLPQRV